jgi:hypothetical protein
VPSTYTRGISLYASTVQAPDVRGPEGLNTLVGSYDPIGTVASNRNASVQRPLARQRVMLSLQVNAYYGLIRASASLPVTYGFVPGLLRPRIRLWAGTQRVPNLLRVAVRPCRLPYPGGPRTALGCRFLRGAGLRPDIMGSASTLKFSRLQSSR